MADSLFNVLFLCTGNSSRSIIAESILKKDGHGRFNAYSAGSDPKGAVHPFALKVLKSFDYPYEGFSSKPWDIFATREAPKMDFVFTVCDDAAGEACPIWPGQPMTAHWGLEDPAAVEGTDFQRRTAFAGTLRYLRNRIGAFINLPLSSIDRLALNSRLEGIGAMDGTTTKSSDVA
jgi:arsenate reductase